MVFYKRLEIKFVRILQRHINLMSILPEIEKMVGCFEEKIVFQSTFSLKELAITNYDTKKINFSDLAAAFPNLRYVYSEDYNGINRLLPLIRQLPKLKKLHIPKLGVF